MEYLFLDWGSGDGSGLSGRNWLMERFGYVVVIILILVVSIALLVFISKAMTAYKNSPEYLERKRKQPTNKANVREIAKRANLNAAETSALYNFCKVNKTPNIKFLVKNYDAFNDLLHRRYLQIKSVQSPEKISHFFRMRQKCLKTFLEDIKLKNSRALEIGTTFTYTAEKGIHYELPLIEKTVDTLTLEVPPEMLLEKLPNSLDKIILIFISKIGNPYEMETRVVRFQEGKMGKQVLIITHSDKLNPLQRRVADRITLNVPCLFASVEENLTPKEKRYKAILVDVSADGCKVETNLPIKPRQKIYIEGTFNNTVKDCAVGEILRTTKKRGDIFVLHIRFIKISKEAENRIHEYVSSY